MATVAEVTKTFKYRRHRPEDTLLYRVVEGEWETWQAERRDDPRLAPIPPHIVAEVEAFLRCGLLDYGFTLLKCDACQTEVPIAFSCKHRGFCPSCTAKRATETAVHIGENLWPTASARQWVFTFPHPLRALMANDREITNLIHQEVHKMVQFFYDNQAHK